MANPDFKAAGGQFVGDAVTDTLKDVVEEIGDIAKETLARRHGGPVAEPEFGVRACSAEELRHGALARTVGDEAIDLSTLKDDPTPKP